MKRARVLVADDHAPSVVLWRSLLQREFEVIATVETGDELVAAAAQLSPDVIVSDIVMAGLDGIGAAEQILRNDPAARIVVVTVLADPAMVRRGLRAGALGYVLKMSAGEDLVPAVRAALRGERHVSAMPDERRAWNAR
jgi:DNA-binding NarL/FixJ family response regulator